MTAMKIAIALLLVVGPLGSCGSTAAERCPSRASGHPGREVVCYTRRAGETPKLDRRLCYCTVLILEGCDLSDDGNNAIDFAAFARSARSTNPRLRILTSIADSAGTAQDKSTIDQLIRRISAIIEQVDGVELDFTAGSKVRLTSLLRGLKRTSSANKGRMLIVRLPVDPERLAKHYELKELAKHADLFSVPTHYLTDAKEESYVTFHPSRLMGLFDMLNTDSLVDLIHGLGAPKDKILISVPGSAYEFRLLEPQANTPRSATREVGPRAINRKQLCKKLNDGVWTVERDDDLTAPYAFKNTSWIAFEDETSIKIKSKYVILRDLAGLAVHDIDDDVENPCGKYLVEYIQKEFSALKRKTREVVLSALEEDLQETKVATSRHVRQSEFRITRVIDSKGHIIAVRESTETAFVCPHQGYFVHPKSCNRFYRCVKFNQEVEHYTVFEFDCPDGLTFDEKTEVCVWPGSQSHGSACHGSSEIAPVSHRRFDCPSKPGFYADPHNCRWFFACYDLGGPHMVPYEFRCPYGLVFDEHKLACEWPWMVPNCKSNEHGEVIYNYGGHGHFVGTSDQHGQVHYPSHEDYNEPRVPPNYGDYEEHGHQPDPEPVHPLNPGDYRGYDESEHQPQVPPIFGDKMVDYHHSFPGYEPSVHFPPEYEPIPRHPGNDHNFPGYQPSVYLPPDHKPQHPGNDHNFPGQQPNVYLPPTHKPKPQHPGKDHGFPEHQPNDKYLPPTHQPDHTETPDYTTDHEGHHPTTVHHGGHEDSSESPLSGSIFGSDDVTKTFDDSSTLGPGYDSPGTEKFPGVTGHYPTTYGVTTPAGEKITDYAGPDSGFTGVISTTPNPGIYSSDDGVNTGVYDIGSTPIPPVIDLSDHGSVPNATDAPYNAYSPDDQNYPSTVGFGEDFPGAVTDFNQNNGSAGNFADDNSGSVLSNQAGNTGPYSPGISTPNFNVITNIPQDVPVTTFSQSTLEPFNTQFGNIDGDFGKVIPNFAGSTTFSPSNNSNTFAYNNALTTGIFDLNDIPDIRNSYTSLPNSFIFPSGNSDNITQSDFTTGGFTKTGPTKTGITTAQLGGSGSYVIAPNTPRPQPSSDFLGPSAFSSVLDTFDNNVGIDNSTVLTNFANTTNYHQSTILPSIRDTTPSPDVKPIYEVNVDDITTTPLPMLGLTRDIPQPNPPLTSDPQIYSPDVDSVIVKFPSTLGNIGVSSTPAPLAQTAAPTDFETGTPDTFLDVGVSFNDVGDFTSTGAQQRTTSAGNTDFTNFIGNTGETFNYQRPTSDFVNGVTPNLGLTAVSSAGSTYFADYSDGGQTINSVTDAPVVLSTGPVSQIIRTDFGSPIVAADFSNVRRNPGVVQLRNLAGLRKPPPNSFNNDLLKSNGNVQNIAVNPLTVSNFTRTSNATLPSVQTNQSQRIIIKLSDLHPLIIGKLGAECVCKPDSNPQSQIVQNLRIGNSNSDNIYVDLEVDKKSSATSIQSSIQTTSRPPIPRRSGTRVPTASTLSNRYLSASTDTPIQEYLPSQAVGNSPLRRSQEVMTAQPRGPSSFIIRVADTQTAPVVSVPGRRGKSFRLNPLLAGKKSARYQNDLVKQTEVNNRASGILSQLECARPGLFRHPRYCNKFYVCHWDRESQKFNLHVFSCSVKLAFDSNASACNWPMTGPACQDDKLLV